MKYGPKKATLLKTFRKSVMGTLKRGLILCTVVISFVHTVLCRIHVEKSVVRRPADIIHEIRQLAADGYKEITLLGQNVNAYGKDFDDVDYRFGDLMDDLRKIDIPRIRFTTSHPRDFDDHLIEVLAKGGNLVDHIHLPVQSGSSEILKIMGRAYSREEFLSTRAKDKNSDTECHVND